MIPGFGFYGAVYVWFASRMLKFFMIVHSCLMFCNVNLRASSCQSGDRLNCIIKSIFPPCFDVVVLHKSLALSLMLGHGHPSPPPARFSVVELFSHPLHAVSWMVDIEHRKSVSPILVVS